jgi:cation transport regulator ChaC
MDVNKEAEEYANNVRKGVEFDCIEECRLYIQNAKEDFISGHNSKSTQAKIIQVQIDILKEYSDYYWNKISTERILKHIEILQKELKQLENEIS